MSNRVDPDRINEIRNRMRNRVEKVREAINNE